ncbi:substrate-binding domain-containing protein [Bradyrhizobium sp. USDA 4486]
MEKVRVLSTLGLMGAMRSLSSAFEAAHGMRVDADFAPTLALLERLRGGEAADLVILTREGLDEMIGEGRVIVDGIEVIGPIPHELQTPTVFCAGRMASAKHAEAADRLLRYLSSPEVVPVLRQSGLEP